MSSEFPNTELVHHNSTWQDLNGQPSLNDTVTFPRLLKSKPVKSCAVNRISANWDNLGVKPKDMCKTVLPQTALDVCREHSEVSKQDFVELFNCLEKLPTDNNGINRFSRHLGLNTWLGKTCSLKRINHIDNFNLLWGCIRADGIHPSRSGVKVLMEHFWFQSALPIDQA